jgi:hypothetical protein
LNPRHEVARELLAGTNGVSVYRSSPEQLAVPAIVILPRSPYRIDGTYCEEQWALALTMLVSRQGDPDATLDALDDLIGKVRDIIRASDLSVTWEGVTDIGVTEEVGGVASISAVANITIYAGG